MLSVIRDALNGMGIHLPEVPGLVFSPPAGSASATIGDMLANTVPVLDFFQSLWMTAINAANALPHHPPVYTQDIEADMGSGIVKTGTISYNAAERSVRISIDEDYGSGIVIMRTNAVVWFALQLILLCPFNLVSPELPTLTQLKGFAMNVVNDIFDALGWARPFPFAPDPPPVPSPLPIPKMPDLPFISGFGAKIFPRSPA
jgi:hypothetical protein